MQTLISGRVRVRVMLRAGVRVRVSFRIRTGVRVRVRVTPAEACSSAQTPAGASY